MASYVQIGRLVLGPPTQWHEAVGDPITNLGGAAIPAPRQALRHQISLATYAGDGLTDTVAARLTMRRQLRSLLNNTPLKLQGYLYVIYSDDPEQNGWYAPDFGQLTDIEGSAGLATGVWKLEQVAWIMAGHRRINREGRNIWMKDMRTGLNSRDFLKFLYTTDFSGLSAVQLSPIPHGAFSIANAVNGQVVTSFPGLTGRGGAITQMAVGLVDLACIAYDRLDSSWGLSDVIVYDRQGSNILNFVKNPSFEYDTVGTAPAGWTTASAFAVYAVQAGWAQVGTNALRMTSAALTPAQQQATQAIGGGISNGIPITGGQQYTFSGWVNRQSSGGTSRTYLQINWLDVAGTFISASTSTGGGSLPPTAFSIGGATGINRDFATVTAPSNAFYAQALLVQNGGASGGTSDAYFDALMFNAGSLPATYADGDTPGFWWNGTYGNSVTIAQPVEVYGPDYAWPWIAATPTSIDCPVLDNGLVRIRYDTANAHGFCVDVWSGSAYIEQGKMLLVRWGDNIILDTILISAGVVEYTPDRAVVKAVMANNTDLNSRESVYITLQRGELGVTFESYAGPRSNGSLADTVFEWTPAQQVAADTNNAVAQVSNLPFATQGNAVYASTAGAGAGTGHSGPWAFNPSGFVLSNSFANGENWLSILRCPSAFATIGPWQTNLIVVQSAIISIYTQAGYGAYPGAVDSYQLSPGGTQQGYIQAQVAFGPTVSDQIMEAESMTLGTGTVTAVDALASGTGSNTTTATRTTDAIHISRANWPNSLLATYRLFARAKVSANSATLYAYNVNSPASIKPCSTGADDATVGTVAWTNPGNVVNNNPAAPASVALTAAQLSHYLKVTNFLFAIPVGAVIAGIGATVYRFCVSGFIKDNSVKLYKAGAIVGTEHADSSFWFTTTGGQLSYGGINDLWGTTWTPADINNVGFGIGVSATASGGSDTAKAILVQMQVYYVLASALVSATAYQWYDLGEVSASGQLSLHGWMSGGAGTLSVDRLEAVMVQDRVRNGAIYSGARDQGQAALMDSRVEGCLVSR